MYCAASLQQPCHSLTICLHKEPDMPPVYSIPVQCNMSPPKLYLQGVYLPFTCTRPKGRPRAPPHGPRASPGHSSPRPPPPLPLPACSLLSSPSAPRASSHMPTQVCCSTSSYHQSWSQAHSQFRLLQSIGIVCNNMCVQQSCCQPSCAPAQLGNRSLVAVVFW